MVKTINLQPYVDGTVAKNGIIYSDVNFVNFLLPDSMITAYREIGVIEDYEDPITFEMSVRYRKLSVEPIVFTDQSMKVLLDATGGYFNSNQSNLLVAGMKSYSDLIILNDITNKPENYFGITIDKWEQVP